MLYLFVLRGLFVIYYPGSPESRAGHSLKQRDREEGKGKSRRQNKEK
jgi:hypothetical protein